LQQPFHGGASRREPGREAFAADGMNVRTTRDEERGDFDLVTIDCAAEGRFTGTVAGFDGGAAIEKRPGNLHVTASRGHMEGGAAFDAVTGVEVGSGPHEDADDEIRGTHEALVSYGVERRVPACVFHVRVDAQTQQQFDKRKTPYGGGFVEEGATSVTLVQKGRFGAHLVQDMFQEGALTASDHQHEQTEGNRGSVRLQWGTLG
jgi:hypothetical protein